MRRSLRPVAQDFTKNQQTNKNIWLPIHNDAMSKTFKSFQNIL